MGWYKRLLYMWYVIHLFNSCSCLLCSSSTPSQWVSWRGVKYRLIISSITVCSFSVSGRITASIFLSTVERSHMDTRVVVTCVFVCVRFRMIIDKIIWHLAFVKMMIITKHTHSDISAWLYALLYTCKSHTSLKLAEYLTARWEISTPSASQYFTALAHASLISSEAGCHDCSGAVASSPIPIGLALISGIPFDWK